MSMSMSITIIMGHQPQTLSQQVGTIQSRRVVRHANGHGTRHPFATTARGRFVVRKPLLPVHALRFAVDCCCSSIIDWSMTGRRGSSSSGSMITRHGVMNEAARENESKTRSLGHCRCKKNLGR